MIQVDRRTQVLACIVASVRERGYPPTVREIARKLGIASTSTVQHHLDQLAADGLIERADTFSRGIRVTGLICPHCNGTGIAPGEAS